MTSLELLVSGLYMVMAAGAMVVFDPAGRMHKAAGGCFLLAVLGVILGVTLDRTTQAYLAANTLLTAGQVSLRCWVLRPGKALPVAFGMALIPIVLIPLPLLASCRLSLTFVSVIVLIWSIAVDRDARAPALLGVDALESLMLAAHYHLGVDAFGPGGILRVSHMVAWAPWALVTWMDRLGWLDSRGRSLIGVDAGEDEAAGRKRERALKGD